LHEVRSFEDRWSYGGKRPDVAEKRRRPAVRDANVGPILETKIVGFKDEPKRDGQKSHASEGEGSVVEARSVGEGEDGRVRDKNVGAPDDGGEKRGDGFDAAEHQQFGGRERHKAEPSVKRKGAAARDAEISGEEGQDGGRREADTDARPE